MSADEEVLGRHVYLFGDYPGIGGVSWLSDQDRSTNLLPLNSSGCSRMKMPVGPIWSRGAGLRVSVARVAVIRLSMTCRPANGTGNAKNVPRTVIGFPISPEQFLKTPTSRSGIGIASRISCSLVRRA